MPVTFGCLSIGTEYERPSLAELWGYKSHHAISRGVVTPTGTRFIILFVTKEKQEVFTQYRDYLDDGALHWEGEVRHGSDERIVSSEQNDDEVHLFFRERHHSPFTYLGQVYLTEFIRRAEAPSRFVFRVPALSETTAKDPIRDIQEHSDELSTLTETERLAIIQSRVGQGRFRRDVLSQWGGCAVTDVVDKRVLMASHVKPWCVATNQERLDPHNGLALVPNLDVLFDSGLITFDVNGRIRTSENIDGNLLKILGVEEDMHLHKKPERLESYLQYHRRQVFQGLFHADWELIGNGE